MSKIILKKLISGILLILLFSAQISYSSSDDSSSDDSSSDSSSSDYSSFLDGFDIQAGIDSSPDSNPSSSDDDDDDYDDDDDESGSSVSGDTSIEVGGSSY